MNRLIEKIVFSGFRTACRLAACPTRTSPPFPIPTTEGVSRFPSSLMMILGSPPSITATTEFVVPRSIPMIFAIFILSSLRWVLPKPLQSAQHFFDEAGQYPPVHRLRDISDHPHLDRPHPPRLAVLGGQKKDRDPGGDPADRDQGIHPPQRRGVHVDHQEIGAPPHDAAEAGAAVGEQFRHRSRLRERPEQGSHRTPVVPLRVGDQHDPPGLHFFSSRYENNQ